MHLWVHGSHSPDGPPVILADITGDQFGHPALQVLPFPVAGYFANTAQATISRYGEIEQPLVEAAMALFEAARHLND